MWRYPRRRCGRFLWPNIYHSCRWSLFSVRTEWCVFGMRVSAGQIEAESPFTKRGCGCVVNTVRRREKARVRSCFCTHFIVNENLRFEQVPATASRRQREETCTCGDEETAGSWVSGGVNRNRPLYFWRPFLRGPRCPRCGYTDRSTGRGSHFNGWRAGQRVLAHQSLF